MPDDADVTMKVEMAQAAVDATQTEVDTAMATVVATAIMTQIASSENVIPDSAGITRKTSGAPVVVTLRNSDDSTFNPAGDDFEMSERRPEFRGPGWGRCTRGTPGR